MTSISQQELERLMSIETAVVQLLPFIKGASFPPLVKLRRYLSTPNSNNIKVTVEKLRKIEQEARNLIPLMPKGFQGIPLNNLKIALGLPRTLSDGRVLNPDETPFQGDPSTL